MFAVTMLFLGCNLLNLNWLKCVSMNNQGCSVRWEIINININEPSFYPYRVNINKRSDSCNNINNPYPNWCVPHVIKNMNVKVFNLMSRTNEINEMLYIEWHETCKCKCKLDASVCNNKQGWNKDECRCECKELINKGINDKGFIWNPSNWECECDKSYDVGEYLDYEICKSGKKLIDKLVEEGSGNIDEKELHSKKMIYNSTVNGYEKHVVLVQHSIVFHIVHYKYEH